jgi:AcrR family transcriptional regulator
MKNDKRNQILDAMEQLMETTPDKDISVNLIAKTAGIGKGSIYYYFESKEEILDAVIERSYKKAIHEYLDGIKSETSLLKKIKSLFRSMIQQEFHDKQKNLILTLHLHEDTLLHNKMKLVAIQEVAPVLEELLKQGIQEGSIHTETPKESAEMIVAVLTFFLDGTVFSEDDASMQKRLKIFASVLETCLQTEKGSFDFLWNPDVLFE